MTRRLKKVPIATSLVHIIGGLGCWVDPGCSSTETEECPPIETNLHGFGKMSFFSYSSSPLETTETLNFRKSFIWSEIHMSFQHSHKLYHT